MENKTKPFVLGAIFARGGSKGVPKKNIRLLDGKPLIAYAIETARAVGLIDEVIVSTDNAEIAAIARRFGAQVPFMRPAALAADDSPELLSWRHAIIEYAKEAGRRVDVLAVVPATSPLRATEDVERCVQKLMETMADVVITVTPAHRNPYFNMVAVDKQGRPQLAAGGLQKIHRRQEAPEVFDMTTVAYAARADYILRHDDLLAGHAQAVVVPKERALDIDDEIDFELAEFFIRRRGAKVK